MFTEIPLLKLGYKNWHMSPLELKCLHIFYFRLNLMASQQSRDFKAHRDYRARVRKRTAEKGAYVRRPRAGKFLDPFSGNAIVEKKGGAAGVNASNVQAPGNYQYL